MKLKEIVIKIVFLLPFSVVFVLFPAIALVGISRLFELFSVMLEDCAEWLVLGFCRFLDWVLVVTGIEEKESVDEL